MNMNSYPWQSCHRCFSDSMSLPNPAILTRYDFLKKKKKKSTFSLLNWSIVEIYFTRGILVKCLSLSSQEGGEIQSSNLWCQLCQVWGGGEPGPQIWPYPTYYNDPFSQMKPKRDNIDTSKVKWKCLSRPKNA